MNKKESGSAALFHCLTSACRFSSTAFGCCFVGVFCLFLVGGVACFRGFAVCVLFQESCR